MKICHRCGTSNQDNYKCCYNCGTPLTDKNTVKEEEEPIIPQESEESSGNDEYAYIPEDDSLAEEERHENEVIPEEAEDAEDVNVTFIPKSQNRKSKIKRIETKQVDEPEEDEEQEENKKPVKKGLNSRIPVSTLIVVIAIVILFLCVVVATIKILNDYFYQPIVQSTPTPTAEITDPTKLYAESTYIHDETILGDKIYKVTIRTNGDMVYLNNIGYAVSHGSVTISGLTEKDILSFGAPLGGIEKGEKCDVDMLFVITKEGFEDLQYTIKFVDITVPMVSFELVSPADFTSTTYKTNTQVSFVTDRNALVYINGVDYTQYLDKETGLFSTIIRTPIKEDSYYYEITVESDDYLTRTVQFEIFRSTEADPNNVPQLTVDGCVYEADEDGYVTVKGTFTGAHDAITFEPLNNNSLETESITFDEDGEGRFIAVLKSSYLGVSEVSVTCTTDFGQNKTVYITNMSNSLLTEKQVSLYKDAKGCFTATCQEIKNFMTSLSGSKHTVSGMKLVAGYNYKCLVKEIIDGQFGKIAVLDLTPDGETETLLYAELLTDTSTLNPGDTVKIFGSSATATEDKIPRLLAVATYKTKY